ncbi:MAG: DNA primase [Dehalococcoidales bacterium]|nr:DNA primase [Dehalococcoidales bacterium]
MSTIDEVKQKLDIVEVIGQYVKLTKAGRNFKAVCPFHNEKTASFYVFPERQSWHCFGACSIGGDIFSFVMKKEGLDFGEALRLLADKAGVSLPSGIERGPGKDEKEKLFQANEAAVQYYHNLLVNSPAGEKAKNYLLSRGLTAKTITDFQLGFSPNAWELLKLYLLERGYSEAELLDAGLILKNEEGKTHDRFRTRLMFPIRDARGRTTGFSGRVLDDSLPKYMNSPQTAVFDKSGTIYGIDMAGSAIRSKDVAIIVEGYMDVIVAHQYGFTNVVASMGTAITEKHIAILKKLTKNIALALDPDVAGEEAMLRCVEYENSLNTEVKVIILPPGKDPDEVIKENPDLWQELAGKAVPVIDYTIDMAVSRQDMSTASAKSQVANNLLSIIARVSDDIRRDHYLTKLSKLASISYNKLEGVLKEYLKPKSQKRGVEQPAPLLTATVSSPREEYCLALLLQHPELKNQDEGLQPDYFQNIVNREIYFACLEADDSIALKEKLEPAVREKLDAIMAKHIPANRISAKYAECVLALRKAFLLNQEAMRAEVFAMVEAETGGTGAALAKLKEEGIEPSMQLKDVFARKPGAIRRNGNGSRRNI